MYMPGVNNGKETEGVNLCVCFSGLCVCMQAWGEARNCRDEGLVVTN